MRSLADLLGSDDGLGFLRSRGVLVTQDGFRSALRPPADPGLAAILGRSPGEVVVYAAHQLQCDYPRSVAAKLRALRDLDRGGGIAAVCLWLDMDRIGANRASATLSWARGPATRSVRLVPRRFHDLEPRFAPVDRSRLLEAAREIESWVSDQSDEARSRARDLGEVLTGDRLGTLAEVNHALTSFEILHALRYQPPSVLVSRLSAAGLLTETVDHVIENIEDFVSVFNQAIDRLAAADVDPQVGPLGPAYLPLRYSCPADGTRLPLRHERSGSDHFAVASCRCGAGYRFHLGGRSLSIRKELAPTGRWSTDVTLPLYLSDLASGVVVGRSSGLYGLVLNDVAERVLGKTAIPMLVPADLDKVLADPDPVDSLFFESLIAP